MFLAVGERGFAATSSDTITWTTFSTYAGKNLRAVIYADAMFIIVGNDGTILTSRDALAWAKRLPAAGDNLRDVTWYNGGFVAVGNDGAILQSERRSLSGRPRTAGFELTVVGESGLPQRIQASSNLGTWVDLFSFTNIQAITTFLDTSATNHQHRFYRTVSP